jgi:2'-phosphotransferase
MRGSSQIFIFIDVQRALASGIKFVLSDNGVVLTEGDERGFLSPEFFERVEDAKGALMSGWERVQTPAVVTQPRMDSGHESA